VQSFSFFIFGVLLIYMREQGYNLPRSYRKIGIGFFLLAILTLVLGFYLIWAKVTITIYPSAAETSQELIFTIKEGTGISSFLEDEVVPGKIKIVEVEGSSPFTVTGSKLVRSDIVGEVTIINNYSKEQTLIETTRLADPSDPETVLVRLKKTITVNPGQQIKVQVYPERPDDFKDIKPQRLIIPGLWGPLQDKIYAQNSETLSNAGYAVSVVTNDDLAQSEKDLKEQLYLQSLSEASQQLEAQETLWPKLVSAKIESVSHDAQVGDEAAEFTTTMKLKAVVVVFDESHLISSARNRLKADLAENQQLVDLDSKSFSYAVEEYDLDQAEATVRATFQSSSIPLGADQFLDKSKLLGLTKEEIEVYFSQFPEIESVEVKFQPGWLKKTPRFKNKINIEIGG